MGTRVSYPVEVKMKDIEMRLAKVPVKEVMEELNSKLYAVENMDVMVSKWRNPSSSTISWQTIYLR